MFVLSAFSALSQSHMPLPEQFSEEDSLVYQEKGLFPARIVLKEDIQTNNPTFERSIKRDFRKKYQGREFDYREMPLRESFFQKLRRRIIRFLSSIFDQRNYRNASAITVNILKVLGIAALGFVLYLFIRFLIKKEGGWFFGKKNKSIQIRDEKLTENIHEMNFPDLIFESTRNGDFRSAIRYQFLLILKKLTDQNAISWHPEKTNQDYIAELQNQNLKNDFRELARIFEYIWYGEFPVSAEDYSRYATHFQNFKV